jgi:hypothetical protein
MEKEESISEYAVFTDRLEPRKNKAPWGGPEIRVSGFFTRCKFK